MGDKPKYSKNKLIWEVKNMRENYPKTGYEVKNEGKASERAQKNSV